MRTIKVVVMRRIMQLDMKMGKMRIVMQMSKIRKLMKTKRRVDFEYKNRNDDKY